MYSRNFFLVFQWRKIRALRDFRKGCIPSLSDAARRGPLFHWDGWWTLRVTVIRTWKSPVLFLWRSGQETSGLQNNGRGGDRKQEKEHGNKLFRKHIRYSEKAKKYWTTKRERRGGTGGKVQRKSLSGSNFGKRNHRNYSVVKRLLLHNYQRNLPE